MGSGSSKAEEKKDVAPQATNAIQQPKLEGNSFSEGGFHILEIHGSTALTSVGLIITLVVLFIAFWRFNKAWRKRGKARRPAFSDFEMQELCQRGQGREPQQQQQPWGQRGQPHVWTQGPWVQGQDPYTLQRLLQVWSDRGPAIQYAPERFEEIHQHRPRGAPQQGDHHGEPGITGAAQGADRRKGSATVGTTGETSRYFT